MKRLCVVPGPLVNVGGPAAFQRKLVSGLAAQGIEVTYELDDLPFDAVLVINGTRQLARLWRCKRQGIKIIQRLGGINWLHRYWRTDFRGYLLAECRNVLMRFIRHFLADHVVYQSHFVRDWWEKECGPTRVASTVIYNGVDLSQFSPEGPKYKSSAEVCIISVEGTQGTDPFNIAISLGRGLQARGLGVELLVFGVPCNYAEREFAQYPFVRFKGKVPNSELAYYYRGASFFISTDIIAACPNSVLEALACGTPVLGYKIGALPELLDEYAGRLVDCDGNPMRGEAPGNVESLVQAALEIVSDRDAFSQAARKLAEQRYSLDHMVDAYVNILRTLPHR